MRTKKAAKITGDLHAEWQGDTTEENWLIDSDDRYIASMIVEDDEGKCLTVRGAKQASTEIANRYNACARLLGEPYTSDMAVFMAEHSDERGLFWIARIDPYIDLYVTYFYRDEDQRYSLSMVDEKTARILAKRFGSGAYRRQGWTVSKDWK